MPRAGHQPPLTPKERPATNAQPEPAAACPAHHYTPYERKPLGQWTAFYDRLRQEAPVVRNLFGRGYFIPTRHEDILAVLQDPETFSSEAMVAYEPDPAYKWIPAMINGEEHRQWRRQLGPYFSPREIEKVDARVRARARGLIEQLAGRGSCDLMTDFALKFPTAVVLEVVGLPDEDLLNYWQFLVQAGLDSVAGMLGYFFHHLATHPADRRRIVDQPETIQAAMEEMLRAFSFIVTGRKVTKDTEIAGCPVTAGSMVQLALKMSGHDDTFYDDASVVDLDRGTRATTWRSARARTGAWARTWPGESCRSRWRSGTPSSRTTGWVKASRSRSSAAAQE